MWHGACFLVWLIPSHWRNVGNLSGNRYFVFWWRQSSAVLPTLLFFCMPSNWFHYMTYWSNFIFCSMSQLSLLYYGMPSNGFHYMTWAFIKAACYSDASVPFTPAFWRNVGKLCRNQYYLRPQSSAVSPIFLYFCMPSNRFHYMTWTFINVACFLVWLIPSHWRNVGNSSRNRFFAWFVRFWSMSQFGSLCGLQEGWVLWSLHIDVTLAGKNPGGIPML